MVPREGNADDHVPPFFLTAAVPATLACRSSLGCVVIRLDARYRPIHACSTCPSVRPLPTIGRRHLGKYILKLAIVTGSSRDQPATTDIAKQLPACLGASRFSLSSPTLCTSHVIHLLFRLHLVRSMVPDGPLSESKTARQDAGFRQCLTIIPHTSYSYLCRVRCIGPSFPHSIPSDSASLSSNLPRARWLSRTIIQFSPC